jgi:hypothetical protein
LALQLLGYRTQDYGPPPKTEGKVGIRPYQSQTAKFATGSPAPSDDKPLLISYPHTKASRLLRLAKSGAEEAIA